MAHGAPNRQSTGSGTGSARERAQPRPAFGLRPWFALLRRARSLRRFAFAMRAGTVPARRRYGPLVARSGRWSHCPVDVALSFHSRFRGLRPASDGRGLLLRGSSVTGRGMRDGLGLAFLSADGQVIHTATLDPGRTASFRGSYWVLELPQSELSPPVGSFVVLCRPPPTALRCASWPER